MCGDDEEQKYISERVRQSEDEEVRTLRGADH
jgi:hypothetical protein